jgi:hypothetical protein
LPVSKTVCLICIVAEFLKARIPGSPVEFHKKIAEYFLNFLLTLCAFLFLRWKIQKGGIVVIIKIRAVEGNKS